MRNILIIIFVALLIAPDTSWALGKKIPPGPKMFGHLWKENPRVSKSNNLNQLLHIKFNQLSEKEKTLLRKYAEIKRLEAIPKLTESMWEDFRKKLNEEADYDAKNYYSDNVYRSERRDYLDKDGRRGLITLSQSQDMIKEYLNPRDGKTYTSPIRSRKLYHEDPKLVNEYEEIVKESKSARKIAKAKWETENKKLQIWYSKNPRKVGEIQASEKKVERLINVETKNLAGVAGKAYSRNSEPWKKQKAYKDMKGPIGEKTPGTSYKIERDEKRAKERVLRDKERAIKAQETAVHNTAANEAKIQNMLNTPKSGFTEAERWLIHYKTKRNTKESFAILNFLLKQNNLDVIMAFAEGYEEPITLGTKLQDFDKGTEMYRKAAELGHPEAMERLAWKYMRGRNTGGMGKKDDHKAIEWFIKYDKIEPSIENKRYIAQLYRGESGYGRRTKVSESDIQNAEEWELKVEKEKMALEEEFKNNPSKKRPIRLSGYQLKQKQIKERTAGVDKDAVIQRYYAYKFQDYAKKMKAGDAEVAKKLAQVFEQGRMGFAKDTARAVKYYKLAGEKGDVGALSAAGRLLKSKNTGASDPVAGLKLLHKAYDAEPNYYSRMRILNEIISSYHKRGPKETRNPEKYAKWKQRSVDEQKRVKKGGLPSVDIHFLSAP